VLRAFGEEPCLFGYCVAVWESSSLLEGSSQLQDVADARAWKCLYIIHLPQGGLNVVDECDLQGVEVV
jgi:hypothetical protein